MPGRCPSHGRWHRLGSRLRASAAEKLLLVAVVMAVATAYSGRADAGGALLHRHRRRLASKRDIRQEGNATQELTTLVAPLPTTQRCVFILGTGRSGSTVSLMRRIDPCSMHPALNVWATVSAVLLVTTHAVAWHLPEPKPAACCFSVVVWTGWGKPENEEEAISDHCVC